MTPASRFATSRRFDGFAHRGRRPGFVDIRLHCRKNGADGSSAMSARPALADKFARVRNRVFRGNRHPGLRWFKCPQMASILVADRRLARRCGGRCLGHRDRVRLRPLSLVRRYIADNTDVVCAGFLDSRGAPIRARRRDSDFAVCVNVVS
jgi:hypothetical protein